jgi:hypothetical protein
MRATAVPEGLDVRLTCGCVAARAVNAADGRKPEFLVIRPCGDHLQGLMLKLDADAWSEGRTSASTRTTDSSRTRTRCSTEDSAI